MLQACVLKVFFLRTPVTETKITKITSCAQVKFLKSTVMLSQSSFNTYLILEQIKYEMAFKIPKGTEPWESGQGYNKKCVWPGLVHEVCKC